MRCCSCQRNVAAGAEAQKMVVEFVQADGTVTTHGFMMPGGPVAQAAGRMLRGWHSRCYWVAKKREAKGNAITGRVVAGSPTGYDITQLVLTRDDLAALGITEAEARERSTVQLSARVNALREVAEQIGKGVGDPQVQEAFAAREHGGPYPHQHHHRLEAYQLIAHLEYAHDVRDVNLLASAGGLHEHHVRLHAAAAQHRAQADREELPTRDWREQFTAELNQETP